MIHAGNLATSKRLQRALAYLRAKGQRGTTGLAWCEFARIMNSGTTASELRANGITVTCEFERVTDDGAKVYRYRLGEEP